MDKRKVEEKQKCFQMRLTLDLWRFLKKQTVDQEESMNKIILKCLEKYKKRIEKRLTKSDTVVS